MHTKFCVPRWINKLVIVLAALALIACSGPTEQQLVQNAKGYLVQNKIYEAAIELKNVLQKNPENAEARFLLGGINFDVGDFDSAEKEFKRAAIAGWSEEQAQLSLARVLLARNALQKLLAEIKVKSSYSVEARANLYALRALALAGTNNMDRAIKLQRLAIKLDPGALYVMKASIQIQLATGNLIAANKSLKQALNTFSDVPEILLLSGLVAMNSKDLDAAAIAFRSVVALEPKNINTFYGRKARLSLARLEITQGRLDQAESALEPLLRQGFNDPEVNFVAGFLAFRQGKLELAEERMLQVLKVASDHTLTQLIYGSVSYALQKYEQAAYYLARYVSVVPDNLRARKLLGRAYIKLDQHEKVQTVLQPALKTRGSDAELLALIGISQLQAGDSASGIKGLESAVKAAPDNLALKNELAKAYISSGETENAVQALNAMLAEGGDQKQTQILLIATHIKSQQYVQAIDIVLNMLRQYPDDPIVLTLAGNVFAISNDRAEARRYFNNALQLSPDYVPATMLLASLEELEGNVDKASQMYKKLAQVNKEDIDSLMALARLAKAQNRPGDMVNWLQQVGKRAPQDIRSRRALVEYYLRGKQLAPAKLLLKEVTAFSSDENPLLDLEARLQMAEGRYNKALSLLDKLVTRFPDSIYAHALIAEVYMKLDQLTDARRELNFVLQRKPDYVPALALMANLEKQTSHFDKAMNFALRLQKIRPDSYLGYEIAGDISMTMKDYNAAKTSYKQAWQRRPTVGLVIKLSEASSYSGKFSEAAKPLRFWLKAHPDDVRVLQLLGVAQLNMKQNSRAIQTFEKVLKHQPDNVVVLNNLAWLYSLSNSPRALEMAEAAYKVRPSNKAVLDTYGWVLVQQGQVEKGRHFLEQAFKALPDVPEVQYHYGVALLKSGEKAKARRILDKLLKSNKPFEGRDELVRLLN